MILESRSFSRSRARTPLTVACVPTGMKTGVSTSPCAVWRMPARAPVSGQTTCSSNRNTALIVEAAHSCRPQMNAQERLVRIERLPKPMSLRFYNTLTQKLEEFTPLHDNVVRMYTCGPTVYNYAHIGNLRSFVFPR